MDKKIYSILVIIFTMSYLTFNLIFYKIELGKEIVNNRMIQYIHKINLAKLFDLNIKNKVIYDENKQSSELAVNNSYSNTDNGIAKETDKSKFNSNEINSEQFISNLEKEKIMNLAKGLAPYDEAKVEFYLDSGSLMDVKSAINLLRERLSDKEFESIKTIWLNYSKN